MYGGLPRRDVSELGGGAEGRRRTGGDAGGRRERGRANCRGGVCQSSEERECHADGDSERDKECNYDGDAHGVGYGKGGGGGSACGKRVVGCGAFWASCAGAVKEIEGRLLF